MSRIHKSKPSNETAHPERVFRLLIAIIALGVLASGAMMYLGVIKMPGNRGTRIFSTPVPQPSNH